MDRARTPGVALRPAAPSDLPAILEIYNHAILHTTAVYSEVPVTLENRQEWLDARLAQGYPVLVAAEGERVVGYSTFADFRAWPGYRHTVEHSVYVHEGARGRGIGTALVAALFPLAGALGKHVMVGGIDADNAPSIALHARLGFEKAAHLREVGRKFDRWLDLVFMQRILGAP